MRSSTCGFARQIGLSRNVFQVPELQIRKLTKSQDLQQLRLVYSSFYLNGKSTILCLPPIRVFGRRTLKRMSSVARGLEPTPTHDTDIDFTYST